MVDELADGWMGMWMVGVCVYVWNSGGVDGVCVWIDGVHVYGWCVCVCGWMVCICMCVVDG